MVRRNHVCGLREVRQRDVRGLHAVWWCLIPRLHELFRYEFPTRHSFRRHPQRTCIQHVRRSVQWGSGFYTGALHGSAQAGRHACQPRVCRAHCCRATTAFSPQAFRRCRPVSLFSACCLRGTSPPTLCPLGADQHHPRRSNSPEGCCVARCWKYHWTARPCPLCGPRHASR